MGKWHDKKVQFWKQAGPLRVQCVEESHNDKVGQSSSDEISSEGSDEDDSVCVVQKKVEPEKVWVIPKCMCLHRSQYVVNSLCKEDK